MFKNIDWQRIKGRNSYYYYYHCSTQCGCRYKADVVNDAFIAELNKYSLDECLETALNNLNSLQLLYLEGDTSKKRQLIGSMYSEKLCFDGNEYMTGSIFQFMKNIQVKIILREIDEQNERLRKARELMLTGKIDPEDYALIKKETQITLNKLEAKVTEQSENPLKVDILLPKAIEMIANIHDLYQVFDREGKRAIIGSMYPEKLHFDGEQHRTARVNVVADAIYLISSTLRGKKEGQELKNQSCPLGCTQVCATRTTL